jgi:tRNA U34 5-carboxymethylaminomethyl modifying enzyme MnmG/GidA
MKQVSEDVIKHFEDQNLEKLLEKYQELETTRELLTQFRAKNAEINTSLKTTKDFFGGRSAESKDLIKNALLELSTLKNMISTIVTRTYQRERALREQQLANLRFIKEAKAFITDLNGNSETGIRSIKTFDQRLTNKIYLYLNSSLIDESDKETLTSILDYIEKNFDAGYEFLYPLGDYTDYFWTRKS